MFMRSDLMLTMTKRKSLWMQKSKQKKKEKKALKIYCSLT